MGEPRADLPLLRLRAFETDWLMPLFDGHQSPLDKMLIIEAGQWIRIGQEFGYFANTGLLNPAVPLPEFGNERGHSLRSTQDFVHCLQDSLDDLTPERREFLETVLFVEDSVFLERLTRVEAVAASFAAGPGAQLPATTLDDAAWGLEGATPGLDTWTGTHPAWWRSSNEALGQGNDRTRERLGALERVRSQMLSNSTARFLRERFDPARHQAAIPIITRDDVPNKTSLTLGVETLGGVASALIPRGTEIPATRTEIFSTADDQQSSVEVHVVLGERAMARDNISVGRFTLSNIPATGRGVPQIEVTFEIDRHGALRVSAREQSTEIQQEVSFTTAQLTPVDVDAHLRDAEAHEEDDERLRRLTEARNDARTKLQHAESLLAKPFFTGAGARWNDTIANAADRLRQNLDTANEDTLRTLARELGSAVGEAMAHEMSGRRPETNTADWGTLEAEERTERKFEEH